MSLRCWILLICLTTSLLLASGGTDDQIDVEIHPRLHMFCLTVKLISF